MNQFSHISRRESGLPQVLSGSQMSMVAFGTVISYGLVSGSAFPLLVAGAAAVPAYLVAATVALLLIACLSSLTGRHVTTGAFGSHAEGYLGPAAGFMVRCAYFVAAVLIIGTEVGLLASALGAWVPGLPVSLLLVAVLAGLGLVNLRGVKAFARLEVLLTSLKVFGLIGLTALTGHYLASGAPSPPGAPVVDIVATIRDVPFSGGWQTFILAVLGFAGLETLAIVAAETSESAQKLRRRMRVTSLAVVGLVIAAVCAATALVFIGGVSLFEAPFGTLLWMAGLKGPNTLFLALITVTVLSVLNSQLYCASRMLFSLARAGQAPTGLGVLSNGTPSRAVIATTGLSVAVFLFGRWLPGGTYIAATTLATTGLLFVWLAIFLSYASYRRGQRVEQAGAPQENHLKALAAMCGALVIFIIAASTWVIEPLSLTLRIGLPFLLFLLLAYLLFSGRRGPRLVCAD